MILPLTSLVTSLELSQRMAKLGAPTETVFYYQMYFAGKGVMGARLAYGKATKPFDGDEYNVPAYLAGEIGEMLPACALTSTGTATLMSEKVSGGWRIGYVDDNYLITDLLVEQESTEVEARGIVWCSLKEQGLI